MLATNQGQIRSGPLGVGTSNRATFYQLGVMCLYLLFHRLGLPESVGRKALMDNGWVSWFTLALQGATLALIARQVPAAGSRRVRSSLLMLSYIALIYLAREADFHRFFTTEHVTRWRFYTDASAPLLERVIAGGVMGLFIACVVAMLIRYAVPTLRALRAGRPWAVSLSLWGIAVIASQVCDQLLRGDYTGRVAEEGLEATAAGLALMTVMHVRANPVSVWEYSRTDAEG